MLMFVTAIAVLPAQQQGAAPEPVRRAHPGRVVDHAGEPVAGAEVTFVSGTLVHGTPEHVVKAETRANGRFRVELLPTRCYRAWAIAPAGTLLDDVPAATPVVELGVPMTELRFDATPQQARTRLGVDGFETWRELGDIRVDVLVEGARAVVGSATVDEQGELTLPPLPDLDLELHVHVGGRFVLGLSSVRSGGDTNVPPPQRLRARVVDAAGAPVPGATIRRLWSFWRWGTGPFPEVVNARRFAIAETDEQGRAELLFAYEQHPFDGERDHWPPLAFVASAPGFGEGISGFTETVVCNERDVSEQIEERTLPFVLTEQRSIEVELVPAETGTALFWTGAHGLRCDENSYTSAVDAAVCAPLVAGAAEVVRWPTTTSEPRLFVAGVVPRLDDADPFRSSATPLPVELVGFRPGEDLRVELAGIAALRVQLLDRRGGPAMGARLACVSLEAGVDEPFAWPVQTDPAGRAVLPLLPGRWLLIAQRGDAWVLRDLAVDVGDPVLELQLEQMPMARFRVVDADGEPVAGAQISSSGASWGGVGDPVVSVLQEFGHTFASRALRGLSSDADGNLDVPLIVADGLDVSVQVRAGAGSSNRFSLVPNDGRVDIVLNQ